MAIYVSILEGPRPTDATPIIVSHDQRVVNAILAVLCRCLGGGKMRAAAVKRRAGVKSPSEPISVRKSPDCD